MPDAPVLEARELTKVFRLRQRGSWLERTTLRAVDSVSLQLFAGSTAALVGQSGSGKSTLVKLLAQLEHPTSGSIRIEEREVSAHWGRSYRKYCELVQIVLQDPYASINPGFRVGRSIRRPLEIHKIGNSRAERDTEVARLLEQVKLIPAQQFVRKFPHELSGGQRQRVAIARALSVGPKVLLADEPVSMLDVSVKVAILRVLNECRDDFGLALLYVTHDIASARWCADTISVMYAGQIVESGPSEVVTQLARHPYTQVLINATPDPAAVHAPLAVQGNGQVSDTSSSHQVTGCRFRGKCPSAMPHCATDDPPVIQLGAGHWARCWLYATNEEH
ncbi:MAG: oligopeptide/dipeptide ABC transporter ATP-binding protein [Streptosporangiaceae bacterium]